LQIVCFFVLQRRDEMKKRHEELGLLDTEENATKKRTVELKNHTIEIAEIDDQFVSKTGLFMGTNQTNNVEVEPTESTIEKPKYLF